MKKIFLSMCMCSLFLVGTSCSPEFENGVSDIDSWEAEGMSLKFSTPVWYILRLILTV